MARTFQRSTGVNRISDFEIHKLAAAAIQITEHTNNTTWRNSTTPIVGQRSLKNIYEVLHSRKSNGKPFFGYGTLEAYFQAEHGVSSLKTGSWKDERLHRTIAAVAEKKPFVNWDKSREPEVHGKSLNALQILARRSNQPPGKVKEKYFGHTTFSQYKKWAKENYGGDYNERIWQDALSDPKPKQDAYYAGETATQPLQLRSASQEYQGKYGDLAEFQRKLQQIHTRILENPLMQRKPSPPIQIARPLTDFELEVLRQAPSHMIGLHYKPKLIAQSLSNNPTLVSLDSQKQERKIKRILEKLANRKLITRSRQQCPRLRDPTHEEITTYTPLVSEVLRSRFKRFGPDGRWRIHFNKGEARAICQDALMDGLATFDDAKTTHGTREDALRSYIKLRMSSKLADAVKQKEKQAKRESLGREEDAGGSATADATEDAKPQFTRQTMAQIFAHHSQGKLNKKEALVLALKGFGHATMAIGKQLNLTSTRIWQIEKEARNKIKES